MKTINIYTKKEKKKEKKKRRSVFEHAHKCVLKGHVTIKIYFSFHIGFSKLNFSSIQLNLDILFIHMN